jgi:hypothetical protein
MHSTRTIPQLVTSNILITYMNMQKIIQSHMQIHLSTNTGKIRKLSWQNTHVIVILLWKQICQPTHILPGRIQLQWGLVIMDTVVPYLLVHLKEISVIMKLSSVMCQKRYLCPAKCVRVLIMKHVITVSGSTQSHCIVTIFWKCCGRILTLHFCIKKTFDICYIQKHTTKISIITLYLLTTPKD